MLTGQLHGAGAVHHPKRQRYIAIALFAAFSLLPDADLLLACFGVHDAGAVGHRGASHSLVTALMIGVACGYFARRMGLAPLRTAVAITIAVGSHGLLDALGEGGRGIPLFWPITTHRFMFPWRFLPDAPRINDYLSKDGAFRLISEFCYFLPMMAYVLWPRRPARPGAGDSPVLTVVKGGRLDTPAEGVAATLPAASADSGSFVATDSESPLRSSG
ncbi:MAG: inner membrane protein [Myxococcales bacterium]|jgi:inner membrane protein|nr:inner membrane protein [Myxococcales bacterium]